MLAIGVATASSYCCLVMNFSFSILESTQFMRFLASSGWVTGS